MTEVWHHWSLTESKSVITLLYPLSSFSSFLSSFLLFLLFGQRPRRGRWPMLLHIWGIFSSFSFSAPPSPPPSLQANISACRPVSRLGNKSCSFLVTTLNFCSNIRDGHVSTHNQFHVDILNSLDFMTLFRSLYHASKGNYSKTASGPYSTACWRFFLIC